MLNPISIDIGRWQPNSEHIHASDKYILSFISVRSFAEQERVNAYCLDFTINGHSPSLKWKLHKPITLHIYGIYGMAKHLTLSCSANERTEMKLKIYLSEAQMCSEIGYQHPIAVKKGLM